VADEAWPKNKRNVWQHAMQLATSTIEQLRKDNRHQQAEPVEAAMRDALRRDMVVVVSWTGEADIDLSVEEPAGTICSLRNLRTTSGGIMLPDINTQQAEDKIKGTSAEVYVCPEGFEGRYRMLLRHV